MATSPDSNILNQLMARSNEPNEPEARAESLEDIVATEARRPGVFQRVKNAAALGIGGAALGLLSLVPSLASADQIIQLIANNNGKHGSRWMSDLKMTNPYDQAIQVTLQGTSHDTSSSAGDPTHTYLIQPGETLGIEDVYGALFGSEARGKARLLITTTDLSGIPFSDPITTANIYNSSEGGEFQSYGAPVQLLPAGTTLGDNTVKGPGERYNFDVTAGANGAIVDYVYRDTAAQDARNATATYLPNSTRQHTDVPGLFGLSELGPNSSITALIREGDANIRGTPVNNATSDGRSQQWQVYETTTPEYDISVYIHVLDNGSPFSQTTHPGPDVIKRIWNVNDVGVYVGDRQWTCTNEPDPVVNSLDEIANNYNGLTAAEQQEFSGDRIGFQPFVNDSDNDGSVCDADEPDHQYLNLLRLTVTER